MSEQTETETENNTDPATSSQTTWLSKEEEATLEDLYELLAYQESLENLEKLSLAVQARLKAIIIENLEAWDETGGPCASAATNVVDCVRMAVREVLDERPDLEDADEVE